MRTDVLAALLVTAGLGTTGAAALAGPSQTPPEAVLQVTECAPASHCGGRLVLAGGPPPWAPAHGYRRKHKQKFEHDYDDYHEHHHYHHYHYDRDDEHYAAVPDVGIELGRCNRELIGGILGGVTGGVVGAQVGKGSNRTAVTIGGTIVGVLIGGAIGRSMDEADQACVAHTWSRRRRATPSPGTTPTVATTKWCRSTPTRTGRAAPAGNTGPRRRSAAAISSSTVPPAATTRATGSG